MWCPGDRVGYPALGAGTVVVVVGVTGSSSPVASSGAGTSVSVTGSSENEAPSAVPGASITPEDPSSTVAVFCRKSTMQIGRAHV